MCNDTPSMCALSGAVNWTPTPDDEHKLEFTFIHATSRRHFLARVRQRIDGKNQFHLCEMRPNGRLCTTNERGHITRAWDDSRIADLERQVGPNGLIPGLRQLGIDPDCLVLWGDGFSVDSIHHESLDDCSREVQRVLAENVRYCAYRRLSSEEVEALRHREAVRTVEYWHDQAHVIRQAEQQGRGLFKGCHNMLGEPLSAEVRRIILKYLNAPTQERWLEVRSYLIAGHITLWQAWCALDPTAPRCGQSGCPSPELVRRAIRNAVASRKAQIEERLKTVGPRGLRVVWDRRSRTTPR